MIMESKIKIFDSSILERKLPYNFEERNPLFAFFKELSIQEVPEIWLYFFENVWVDSDSIIYNDKRQICFEAFDFCLKKKYERILKDEKINFKNLRHPRRLLKSAIKKVRNKFIEAGSINETDSDKKYILITDDRVNNNFYHWINEALLRLLALGNLPENSMLLLPEECWKLEYVRNSLKVFNINEGHIWFIPKGKEVKIKKLEAVSCSMFAPGACNYPLMLRLKGKIEDFYKNQLILDFGDKIYISRQKSKNRKVANEGLVMELLVSYGFKKICAEDYSLIELVSLMARTKYLIGIVSAGLAHMMFMKKGGFVLELIHENFMCPIETVWPGGYSEEYASTHYYSMANALGLEYLYQPCKRINHFEYLPADDIMVDIPQLKKNVELMLYSMR